MTRKYSLAVRPVLLIAALAVCAPDFAQQATPPSDPFNSQHSPHKGPAQPASRRAAKPSPSTLAPAPSSNSLLNEPAQPADVTLANDRLTVKAHNSSLADILNQIAKTGGMKVDGLQSAQNSDQRVFGTYGPGQPREVIVELLDGCGYNVVMLGSTPAGTPKELALTPRPTGGVPNPPPHSAETQPEYTPDYGFQQEQPYPQPTNDAQPPASPPRRNGVRTPQEILQELQWQRQREQQQQQEQQNQQQPN